MYASQCLKYGPSGPSRQVNSGNMCGICGIVKRGPLNSSEVSCVRAMNTALTHRGPDSEGFLDASNASLAIRRLRIIDLSGGDQPLFNEDRSIVLIANAEIYNHAELRERLGKRHSFKTGSDCEVIIHLYEEKKEDCLNELRGMFAFVLYDMKNETLFMARDRFGEKPLYYSLGPDELVFSSELKSLLSHSRPKGVKLDNDSLNMYLHYQYVPEPFTCIEGVHKLPAGHYMKGSLKDFSFSLRKYWDFESIKPVTGDPVRLIRDSFDEMCSIITTADVPVGIALSGGIDSSAIAVQAAKYRKKMHAFSVGYPGRPNNDERLKAKWLADRIGLAFHEVELKTGDLAAHFPAMVYQMDDPIADIAAFGYYSVNRLAREHDVPVLLSGLGGDELFWGYGWAIKAVERNLIKQRLRSGEDMDLRRLYLAGASGNVSIKQALLNPFGAMKDFTGGLRAERAKFLENPDRFIFYEDIPDFNHASGAISALFTDDFKGSVDDRKLFSFFTDGDWEEVPLKVCKFLMHTWLYSNCVALGDRLSMASSIESRLPFLDYKFVELVMGLRKSCLDDHTLGYKKWFIDAMRGIVPQEVLDRKKQGFTPPVEDWYMAIVNRYGGLCADGYLAGSGLMRKERAERFIKAAKGGRNLFFAYKLVLLEVWCRKFVMGEADA